MLIKYILYSISLIFICLFVFIKIKFRFWSSQPVFHLYNLYYWINPVGLLERKIPKKSTKYYDVTIETQKYTQLNTEKKELLFGLVKTNFLHNPIAQYQPTKKDIFNYFILHERACHISFNYIYQNRSKKLISCMTSRPLDCILYNRKVKVGYVDFLCVKKENRKQGNAQKTIHSHYINARSMDSEKIFLFKREGSINFMVPLVVYNAYAFNIKKYDTINHNIPNNIMCTIITDGNYKLLFHYFTEIKKKFKCFITPNLNHIKSQIQNNLLYVCMIFDNKTPVGCYFFKNPHTLYNKKRSLECFASSYSENYKEIFTASFQNCVYLIRQKYLFEILLIENLSDNNLLIKEIKRKCSTIWKVTMAYYFYNFIYRPFVSKNVFLLN